MNLIFDIGFVIVLGVIAIVSLISIYYDRVKMDKEMLKTLNNLEETKMLLSLAELNMKMKDIRIKQLEKELKQIKACKR